MLQEFHGKDEIYYLLIGNFFLNIQDGVVLLSCSYLNWICCQNYAFVKNDIICLIQTLIPNLNWVLNERSEEQI